MQYEGKFETPLALASVSNIRAFVCLFLFEKFITFYVFLLEKLIKTTNADAFSSTYYHMSQDYAVDKADGELQVSHL